MKDLSNNYYRGNKGRKIGDFFIGGLLIPIALYFLYGLLMTVSRNILENQYRSNYSSVEVYNYSLAKEHVAAQGNADMLTAFVIVALVIGAFFLFKKRRYIRVGLSSMVVLLLALPGACFAGFYGGAVIGSASAPASDHYAGLSAGLSVAAVVVVFVGLPASIIIIRKIIKKANSTEKIIEEIAASNAQPAEIKALETITDPVVPADNVNDEVVQNPVVQNTNEKPINQPEATDETTNSNS